MTLSAANKADTPGIESDTLIGSAILDACSFADALDIGVIAVNQNQEIVIWNDWMTRHSFQQSESVVGSMLANSLPTEDDRLGKAISEINKHGLSAKVDNRVLDISLPLYRRRCGTQRPEQQQEQQEREGEASRHFSSSSLRAVPVPRSASWKANLLFRKPAGVV